ncbi:acetyltransferase [Glaciecola sp. MF2-115]|uniref:acetyltransferase n=1 Tax=Glaciecola sp. MF2-115 TaxID=3384827 RepID=UPI00399F8B7A
MSSEVTRKLAIVGASGHGKVVADLAEYLGYTISFYDDAYPQITHLEHWDIKGTMDDLLNLHPEQAVVIVAIGNNVIRETKLSLLHSKKFKSISLIHPTSTVSKYATVGIGSVVLSGAVINSFAKIGKGSIINTCAVVEHDCLLSDFVHLSPNATLAGGVKIGTRTWIGIGSTVKQLVSIGCDTVIGAGSTVLKNIGSNIVAYGSPATIVQENKKLLNNSK